MSQQQLRAWNDTFEIFTDIAVLITHWSFYFKIWPIWYNEWCNQQKKVSYHCPISLKHHILAKFELQSYRQASEQYIYKEELRVAKSASYHSDKPDYRTRHRGPHIISCQSLSFLTLMKTLNRCLLRHSFWPLKQEPTCPVSFWGNLSYWLIVRFQIYWLSPSYLKTSNSRL